MTSKAGRRDGDIVLRPGADGVRLVPDRAYSRAYSLRVGRTDQSYVDLDDPLRLEFDYLQRMADVVDCAAEPGRPLRVVHVGGAAMTLARYIAATRPQSAQLVLEPDAELTAFVRTHCRYRSGAASPCGRLTAAPEWRRCRTATPSC